MFKIAVIITVLVFILSSIGGVKSNKGRESGAKKEKSSIFYQRLFIERTRPVQSLEDSKVRLRTESADVDNAVSKDSSSDTKYGETGSWVKDSVVISRAYYSEDQQETNGDFPEQDQRTNPNTIPVSDRKDAAVGGTRTDGYSDLNISPAEAEVKKVSMENQRSKSSTTGDRGAQMNQTDSTTNPRYEVVEDGNTMTIKKITSEENTIESGPEDIPSVVNAESKRYKIVGEGRTLAVKDGKGYWVESRNATLNNDGMRTPPMDLKALKRAFLKLTKPKPEDDAILDAVNRKVPLNITDQGNTLRNVKELTDADNDFPEPANRVIKAQSHAYKVIGQGRTLAVKDGKAFWVHGNSTESNRENPIFDTEENQNGLLDNTLRFEPVAMNNITEMLRERLFESLKKRVKELLSETRKRGNRKSKNPEQPN